MKDGTDEPIYRAAVDMQTQRADIRTQQRGEKAGRFGKGAWKHVHYDM